MAARFCWGRHRAVRGGFGDTGALRALAVPLRGADRRERDDLGVGGSGGGLCAVVRWGENEGQFTLSLRIRRNGHDGTE